VRGEEERKGEGEGEGRRKKEREREKEKEGEKEAAFIMHSEKSSQALKLIYKKDSIKYTSKKIKF